MRCTGVNPSELNSWALVWMTLYKTKWFKKMSKHLYIIYKFLKMIYLPVRTYELN